VEQRIEEYPWCLTQKIKLQRGVLNNLDNLKLISLREGGTIKIVALSVVNKEF